MQFDTRNAIKQHNQSRKLIFRELEYSCTINNGRAIDSRKTRMTDLHVGGDAAEGRLAGAGAGEGGGATVGCGGGFGCR